MKGHFGNYGGQFVPETLMHPLQQLEEEYFRAQRDPEFAKELQYYLREFCGRPTPLYFAERLTKELGGAKIYNGDFEGMCHSLDDDRVGIGQRRSDVSEHGLMPIEK